MSAVIEPTKTPPGATPTWLLCVIGGFFALLFAFGVWNAIGNLIASVSAGAEQGVALLPLGWVVWIIGALLPIVLFTLAFLIGRRRRPTQLILIMLTALSLEAVFWLNLVGYTMTNTASFFG